MEFFPRHNPNALVGEPNSVEILEILEAQTISEYVIFGFLPYTYVLHPYEHCAFSSLSDHCALLVWRYLWMLPNRKNCPILYYMHIPANILEQQKYLQDIYILIGGCFAKQCFAHSASKKVLKQFFDKWSWQSSLVQFWLT